MKKIFVLYKDFEEYTLLASRENAIRSFWLDILKNAPRKILKEVKNKRTDLVEQDPKKYNITNVVPYLFVAEDASNELVEYLNGYVVFVEHNSPEVQRWKDDLKQENYLRYQRLIKAEESKVSLDKANFKI